MTGSPTQAPGVDRAEDRRRELRETISAITLDLVLERGLDAVTVDEIARAANVSRRTFFNYFPSKAAACIPDAFPPDREAVRLFLTDRSVPTLAALARLLWLQVSRARQETPLFNRFHDMWRREPGVRTEVHAILARTEDELATLVARREGREPGSVEAATVAAASIAIVRVAVEQWRTDESPTLLEDRIRESFDAITRATEVTGR
ncbi:TetR family transcriptional regulator [Dietzia sp. PP-33]|jgi:AcrR family transcriptional regulator|uniref:TetR family transcriptional regulator n=1 Tax=Dietzia sp. PP-33 TaxID=2957500 RepID=UPI0029AD0CA1|nr:TetR family transcriptional regulator [Dietzia sp. PP-33]MDX2356304.1 TetR/AcrR family transcriptional regulator [Dietzia sp. PP-33]